MQIIMKMAVGCVLKVTEFLKQIVWRKTFSLLSYEIEKAKNDHSDYCSGKITMANYVSSSLLWFTPDVIYVTFWFLHLDVCFFDCDLFSLSSDFILSLLWIDKLPGLKVNSRHDCMVYMKVNFSKLFRTIDFTKKKQLPF